MGDYNTTAHKALLAEVDRLGTFAEVADWDARARAELQLIANLGQTVEQELARAQAALVQAESERAGRSFLGRLTGGQRQINEHNATVERLTARRQSLEKLADELEAWIVYTPNDPADQKSLLKELKQHKKELQLKKRELAAVAREIRVAARQQGARVDSSFGGLFVTGVRTAERRSIRLQKEADLRPNESEKSAIERQLLSVDRRILWVERFKGVGG